MFSIDNGPHYHNTAVLLYLAEVNAAFNIKLLEYNDFKAGEEKTVLDTHFAHVSHKIVRWVPVGNNLDSGEQLANLLEIWIIKTKIELLCSEYLHGFTVRHRIFTLA